MKVLYRKQFVKDLRKLKGTSAYQKIKSFAFETLPQAESLSDIPQVKLLKGTKNKFRVRIGDYRIGIEANEDTIEIVRVIHRKEFYRFYP